VGRDNRRTHLDILGCPENSLLTYPLAGAPQRMQTAGSRPFSTSGRSSVILAISISTLAPEDASGPYFGIRHVPAR
jgi:hypothetical protein